MRSFADVEVERRRDEDAHREDCMGHPKNSSISNANNLEKCSELLLTSRLRQHEEGC
jgi:hypothetical protein